jgi:hypothetical protein
VVIGVGAHAENHVAAGNIWRHVQLLLVRRRIVKMNNFTITPPLSKLTVARNLNKYFVLDWQTTVGNVDNKRLEWIKNSSYKLVLVYNLN